MNTAFTNARAGKYSLTPGFAIFMDALARQSLERQQNRIRKRLAHVTKHFEHFIKFALEAVDEITQPQFLTKYPQEHQGKPCSSYV